MARRLRMSLSAALLEALGVLAGLAAPAPTEGQSADREINVFRYILGVDVPQSPALVALDLAGDPVLLGSTHKPLSASGALLLAEGGRVAEAAAVDVSPYFLLGGGRITLERYRSMSVLGRLRRVLIKAVLSAGIGDAVEAGARNRWGVGLRLTLHDPHDVIGSTLPEEIHDAFAAAGVELPPAEERSLHDRGVALEPVYAAARERIRARAGDAQVSAGWAMSRPFGEAGDGVPGADVPTGLDDPRHTLWLAAQYTTGARYDVIANLQHRDTFGDDARVWLGAGVLRKGESADVQGGLTFDAVSGKVHPSASVSGRLGTHVGLLLTVVNRPLGRDLDGPGRFAAGLQARWFYASDRLR